MIAELTGTVAYTEGQRVVLNVSGVGYEVMVPVSTLSQLPEAGGQVTLYTCLILRGQPDMEATLYGFTDRVQLRVFKLLLGASGVGPRIALAILSHLGVADLARALSTTDTRTLAQVPGVGVKMAQKLCFELGEKMAEFVFDQRVEQAAASARTAQEQAVYADVQEALVGLGYSRADARRAAEQAFASAADRNDTGRILSAALALLTSGKRL